MTSTSPPFYQSEYMPFSPFMDPRSRDRIFSEVENTSTNSSENENYAALDLSVKSPSNSPDLYLKSKRKFENSDSEEEIQNYKRQRSFNNTKPINSYPNQLGPLSIVPPTPNPYLNPDLLSPLSLALVPTPYMPLYNIGSPAPPTSAAASSSLNLTPPQTPQATSFPSFLPFQMPPTTSNSQMPDMSYAMNMPYYYNPYSPTMNQLQHPPMVTKTPSPPPNSFDNQFKKTRKILPKPSSSPPLMQHGGQESAITEQTMTINTQGINQTIHIKPLPSPPVSAPPTSSYPTPSQMTTPMSLPSGLPLPPPLMPAYPSHAYPGYMPYPPNPYQQQFMQRPEPKPMSQALSFLFEKSLGSVRRWRENGLTIQLFYCAVCQCPTDNEERMRTHIETFHRDLSSLSPSPSGIYQCGQCEQICSDEASLARHKLIHVNTNSQKSEKCKGCGRSFANQDSLANHEKDCSLYRPYRCEHCGRGYVVAARLKHHRQDCSAGPKPPAFSCKVCSKTFDNFMDYCQHVPVHAFM